MTKTSLNYGMYNNLYIFYLVAVFVLIIRLLVCPLTLYCSLWCHKGIFISLQKQLKPMTGVVVSHDSLKYVTDQVCRHTIRSMGDVALFVSSLWQYITYLLVHSVLYTLQHGFHSPHIAIRINGHKHQTIHESFAWSIWIITHNLVMDKNLFNGQNDN